MGWFSKTIARCMSGTVMQSIAAHTFGCQACNLRDKTIQQLNTAWNKDVYEDYHSPFTGQCTLYLAMLQTLSSKCWTTLIIWKQTYKLK